MKTRLLTVCVVVAGFFTGPGCFDLDSEVVPTVDDRAEPERHLLSVSFTPDSGRIGATINLKCARFHPPRRYSVFFPGAHDAVYVDCETAGTLSPAVPFGATSGPVAVPIERQTAISSTFRVTEQCDTLSVTVKPYDITPSLTPKDSSIVDWQGRHCAWIADIRDDTVHIWRRYSTGDEIYEHHVRLLHGSLGRIPTIIAVWGVAIPDYPGTRVDTIRAGILKIQDWDTSAVMSGRFLGSRGAHIICPMEPWHSGLTDVASAVWMLPNKRLHTTPRVGHRGWERNLL